jgi:hypothetical protein
MGHPLTTDFFAQVVTLVWEPEGGQATRAGFEHLEALKQLRTLHLINTMVTDTGLAPNQANSEADFRLKN